MTFDPADWNQLDNFFFTWTILARGADVVNSESDIATFRHEFPPGTIVFNIEFACAFNLKQIQFTGARNS